MTPEPVLVDRETYEHKIAGLRATLARSHIEIDAGPMIDTCKDREPGARCVRCEIAGRNDTEGFDPDLIDAIAIELASYPTSVLAIAKLEHVALCRSISLNDIGDDMAGGLAMTDQHRLLLSIEPFHGQTDYRSYRIEQVLHHELFHLIDRATREDGKWSKLNPPGFVYRDPAATSEDRPAGFVNTYATTNELEDRASTYEYMIGQPEKLCELVKVDPVLAAKVHAIWKRMAAIAGEPYLRRHAACVIAPPPPARPNPQARGLGGLRR